MVSAASPIAPGKEVDLRAKSGKPLARYFPEVVAMLKALKPQSPFVLDGELAIPIGDTLSFDALQMRIHPAESRIKKLAVETPALLILFDMLLDAKGNSLIEAPLVKRRAALECILQDSRRDRSSSSSRPVRANARKRASWLKRVRAALLTASSPSAATVLTSPASERC